jgi:hypothetical protein
MRSCKLLTHTPKEFKNTLYKEKSSLGSPVHLALCYSSFCLSYSNSKFQGPRLPPNHLLFSIPEWPLLYCDPFPPTYFFSKNSHFPNLVYTYSEGGGSIFFGNFRTPTTLQGAIDQATISILTAMKVSYLLTIINHHYFLS